MPAPRCQKQVGGAAVVFLSNAVVQRELQALAEQAQLEARDSIDPAAGGGGQRAVCRLRGRQRYGELGVAAARTAAKVREGSGGRLRLVKVGGGSSRLTASAR